VTQYLNDPENAQLVLQEAKEALISRDWGIVLEMASVSSRLTTLLTLESPPHGASYGTSL
jgi:hypothetical protein